MKNELTEYIKAEQERKTKENEVVIKWLMYLLLIAGGIAIIALLIQFAAGSFDHHVCITEPTFLSLVGR